MDSIHFQTHTQLLFLTPWVHISMVTSMFVYLFPDFFLESHKGSQFGDCIICSKHEMHLPLRLGKPGVNAHSAFLDSGHLLLIHATPLHACRLGPFELALFDYKCQVFSSPKQEGVKGAHLAPRMTGDHHVMRIQSPPCVLYSQAVCGNSSQKLQVSLPPAWQHQQQKSSPFWTRNHILIPELVPEVEERSGALIGQDRVTCSPTEPMKSHPHPTSWTESGEGVVLRENEGAVTRRGSGYVAGKSSRASAPTFFKAAAVRAPPESPPLAWRLSL